MLKDKLVYILFFACFLSFGQSKMKLASIQQANNAVTNLFPDGNAASSDDVNSASGWTTSGGVTNSSIVSTEGTDNYAIEVVTNNTSAFQNGYYPITGLNTTAHTATIRARRTSGSGGFFNWDGVSGDSYTNADATFWDGVGNGNWATATVTFTVTGTVNLKCYASGSTGGTGDGFEIAYIIITED